MIRPNPKIHFFSKIIALLAFCTSLAVVTANGGPVTLDAPVLSPLSAVSAISYDLVNADFNGDTKLDVATVQFATNTITIVYGDGTGKFSAPTTITTPAGPRALITVDYNGDGKPDLLTPNSTANTFTLFINNGNGTFTDTSFPSGFGPTTVAVGDFNNDTRLDVATTSETANTVNVSLAMVGGGFSAPSLISIPNAVPKFLLAADLNGDGKPDLVTANASASSNNISVFICDGMGGFSAPTNYASGQVNGSPSHIAVGYFNADLNLDLIVTLTGVGKLNFFSGAGNGTFTLANTFTIGNSATIAVTTLLRDINNDAKADLITASYGSDKLVVSFGDGVGGISSTSTFYTAKQPHTVGIGDFNGDGLPDLDTIVDGARMLSVHLNRGPGDFPTVKLVSTIQTFVRTADFNRDGKADLLQGSNIATTNPSVSLGNGNGTFAAPVQIPGTGSNGVGLLIADANSDGYVDILTSNAGGVSIHLNNGSGGFPSVINITTASGQIGLGDFNNDGKTDLVITDSTTMTNNIKLYQGDGLGGFVLASGATFGGTPATLTVSDLNHDNHPDLIVTRGGGFGVMLWTGAFTFATTAYYAPGCSPGPFGSLTDNSNIGTVTVADFNRDGNLDLLRAGMCGILAGNGSGGFAPLGGDTALNFYNPFVGDFDRNGILDVGTENGDSGEMRIYYHDGAGHFSETSYAVARGSQGNFNEAAHNDAVADFTGDGVDDVIYVGSANGGSGTVGTFLLASRPIARGGVTADFDGDGKTDISVFRPSTGSWYIIRSSNQSFYSVAFGQNGDVPVPGDYDGDGKTDIAVFRSGDWYYLRSSDGVFVTQHHGSAGDVPVPADYNGDGITNFAVYRPSTGYWYTSTNPNTNYDAVQWGSPGDLPVRADYDGDGRADVAVFRPSNATWYLLQSTAGFQQVQHGVGTDKPVPADYNGDGKANVAVFRPAAVGFWYTSTDPSTNYGAQQWGTTGDLPVPGYYDGDNKVDIAVFRNGVWYILTSSSPALLQYTFGAAGDIPIPSAYLPQ
jgi:hypothetical protein